MLDRTRLPAPYVSCTAGRRTMSDSGNADRTRRFREAALPHLDDVFTLARYLLRDINDLPYRDIADVLGVPVGTVMSRLARARAMLRARWALEEGSAP